MPESAEGGQKAQKHPLKSRQNVFHKSRLIKKKKKGEGLKTPKISLKPRHEVFHKSSLIKKKSKFKTPKIALRSKPLCSSVSDKQRLHRSPLKPTTAHNAKLPNSPPTVNLQQDYKDRFKATIEREISRNPDGRSLELLRKHKRYITGLETRAQKQQTMLTVLKEALEDKDKAIILPQTQLKSCAKRIEKNLERNIFKSDFLRNKTEAQNVG